MLDWLRLLRASGFCTIASNSIAVVATAFYAGEGEQLKWLLARLWHQRDQVGWVFLTSLLLYAAGMVWNDIVDVEQDRQRRPDRPLARGRLHLVPVMTVGVLLLVAPLMTALQIRPTQYGVSLAGIVLCLGLFYNLTAKSIPVLGAVTMGLTRGCHALFALLILGEDHLRMALQWTSGPTQLNGLLIYPLVITAYTIGITTIARLEDRERGGSRLSLLIGAALLGSAIGLSLYAVLTASWLPVLLRSGTGWALGAMIALGLAVVVALWNLWRIARPWWHALMTCRCRDVGPVIGASLGGMILLDAVLAASGHPLLGLACLALYPVFAGLSRAVRMD